jgi:hypothetical protein
MRCRGGCKRGAVDSSNAMCGAADVTAACYIAQQPVATHLQGQTLIRLMRCVTRPNVPCSSVTNDIEQSIKRQRCAIARVEDVVKLLTQTYKGVPFLSTTARATLPAPNSMKNTKTASISAPADLTPDTSHTAASDVDKTGDVASASLFGTGMSLQEKNHFLQN